MRETTHWLSPDRVMLLVSFTQRRARGMTGPTFREMRLAIVAAAEKALCRRRHINRYIVMCGLWLRAAQSLNDLCDNCRRNRPRVHLRRCGAEPHRRQRRAPGPATTAVRPEMTSTLKLFHTPTLLQLFDFPQAPREVSLQSPKRWLKTGEGTLFGLQP